MISSLQNTKVKNWEKLNLKKYRKNQYLLLEEELIVEAIKYGYLDTLLYVGKNDLDFNKVEEVTSEVMHKISKRDNLRYLGIANMIKEGLNNPSKLVILDNLSDPQNVGMIMHAAELFGFDGIVLSENSVDIYHEKCLSASLGSIYHLDVLRCNLEEQILKLKDSSFKIFATGLKKETKELEEVTIPEKLAFVLGNEGSGVRDEIFLVADEIIKIRMENIDSLNVAMAGTIIMYHFNK